MIKSEYIKKTDAMDIVKRTHGDYATAWVELKRLPAVKIVGEKRTVASWKWNKNGYWECSACNGPSDALMEEDKDVDPYMFINTKFCGRCGAEMEDDKQ